MQRPPSGGKINLKIGWLRLQAKVQCLSLMWVVVAGAAALPVV